MGFHVGYRFLDGVMYVRLLISYRIVVLYRRQNISYIKRSMQCCNLHPKLQDKRPVYSACKTTSPTVGGTYSALNVYWFPCCIPVSMLALGSMPRGMTNYHLESIEDGMSERTQHGNEDTRSIR